MTTTRDVALVTGAGGSLGRAVVAALAVRGDHVVALTKGTRAPDFAAKDAGTVQVETVDLAAPEQVEGLWERLVAQGSTPRWVVNTVGGYGSGTVAATTRDDYRGMLDLNLTTTWESCRAAATRMRAGGAIVNVASRSALTGSAAAAAYAVSKAGVIRLTQVLADELAERRVRVNVVLPALIAGDGDASPRAVPAADIASVIAFLCSDAAKAVTRAAVPVYGWA